MIWLAWRRHRTTTLVVVGVFVLIAVWMFWLAHSFEARVNPPSRILPSDCGRYQCSVAEGPFALGRQAAVINFLLLFAPCLIGIVLGAPLVAGELEHHTNRLTWTQSISRSKWLTAKWVTVGLPMVVAIGLLAWFSQWWTSHVQVTVIPNILSGVVGRIQPHFFAISGVVPIAYTLFSFSLAVALGSLVRRTGWAVAATVVIYGASSLLMVFAIRPNLAPQGFQPQSQQTTVVAARSWNLGGNARFLPGTTQPPGTPSAAEVDRQCAIRNYREGPYLNCLAAHHVQLGFFYQPASNYWVLQWREFAIYTALAVILFGLTLRAVWRWRT